MYATVKLKNKQRLRHETVRLCRRLRALHVIYVRRLFGKRLLHSHMCKTHTHTFFVVWKRANRICLE